MKKTILILTGLLFVACGEPQEEEQNMQPETDTINEFLAPSQDDIPVFQLDLEEANKLAQLPLDCIGVEFPNKLNQVLGSQADIKNPQELHPAFYGCFDWHSSVHGHWALVNLLKQFPKLERASDIKQLLQTSLSPENMLREVAYFEGEYNDTWERPYGWAWLLKLATELHTWDDPFARELEANLQPLTDKMVHLYMDFLPKLNYPIRVGEHTNTAFALVLAHDYASVTQNQEFLDLIEKRARDFYLHDDNCPLDWEPSGFDFLSPCLSEIDIMRRVLPRNAFQMWMEDFMPQLKNKSFNLTPGEVSDRTDGKLVHLDGLNFSRAWVLYGLARQYEEYKHLKKVADSHVSYSFPNLVGDTYEGGHWLGSFALYALNQSVIKGNDF